MRLRQHFVDAKILSAPEFVDAGIFSTPAFVCAPICLCRNLSVPEFGPRRNFVDTGILSTLNIL
jgi:hypothetical protein